MTRALVVCVSASSRKEADRIAQVLVEERLAACASIVPEMYSRYRWKGRIEYDRELLILIKTTLSRYKALEARIRSMHSYEVPEILAIPVIKGNPAYLKWMTGALK